MTNENYIDSRTPEERRYDSKIKSTTTTSQIMKNWEEIYDNLGEYNYGTVKDFIRQLLKEEREEVLREVLPSKRQSMIKRTDDWIEGWNTCREALLQNARERGIEI